jgi:hypothetical protein
MKPKHFFVSGILYGIANPLDSKIVLEGPTSDDVRNGNSTLWTESKDSIDVSMLEAVSQCHHELSDINVCLAQNHPPFDNAIYHCDQTEHDKVHDQAALDEHVH